MNERMIFHFINKTIYLWLKNRERYFIDTTI